MEEARGELARRLATATHPRSTKRANPDLGVAITTIQEVARTLGRTLKNPSLSRSGGRGGPSRMPARGARGAAGAGQAAASSASSSTIWTGNSGFSFFRASWYRQRSVPMFTPSFSAMVLKGNCSIPRRINTSRSSSGSDGSGEGDDAVLTDFLEAYCADRERGVVRTLDDYLLRVSWSCGSDREGIPESQGRRRRHDGDGRAAAGAGFGASFTARLVRAAERS